MALSSKLFRILYCSLITQELLVWPIKQCNVPYASVIPISRTKMVSFRLCYQNWQDSPLRKLKLVDFHCFALFFLPHRSLFSDEQGNELLGKFIIKIHPTLLLGQFLPFHVHKLVISIWMKGYLCFKKEIQLSLLQQSKTILSTP